MSAAAVITEGFGSFGSVALVVTQGFGTAAPPPPNPPPTVVTAGGKSRKWYRVGNRVYKATEQELRQILEALVIEEVEPEATPELPDVQERPAPVEREPIRIANAGLLSAEPAFPQLPDFSALMARETDVLILAMMREIAIRYLEDQDDEDILLLH